MLRSSLKLIPSSGHLRSPALLRLPPRPPPLSRPFALSRPALELLPGSAVGEDFKLDIPPNVYVASISSAGVELGGAPAVVLPGAALLIAGQAFLWNVKLPEEGDTTWSDFSEDAFRVFEIVGPRPEVVVLGTGPTTLLPPAWIKKYFASLGIQLDVMTTRSAASLYNILAEQGTLVAAAFLPLRNVDIRTGKFLDAAPPPSPPIVP